MIRNPVEYYRPVKHSFTEMVAANAIAVLGLDIRVCECNDRIRFHSGQTFAPNKSKED